MGPGISPLDEALELGACATSQQVLSWMVRLGAELPFARAAFWLEELSGVVVSATSVRRQTEAMGATAVAEAEATVERLEREWPVPLEVPERRVVGADGAMVPLVGGEWAEVKLASLGTPSSTPVVRTEQVSYFARLADAEQFSRQALGELHRRGLFHAAAVAAVQDAAPWLQGFVDDHRPDAVRILDWAHAVAHLQELVEAVFGQGTSRARRVAERLRGWLWEQGSARLIAVALGWVRARPGVPDLPRALASFTERRAQLDSPAFRAAGWPVGSGATESGHKQVMQARLKRAGMRWARAHVNPLLALTTLEHNGRWSSDGHALLHAHRARQMQARRARQHARRAARHPVPLAAPPAPPRSCARQQPLTPRSVLPSRPLGPSTPHPWRRYGPPLSAKI